MPTFELSMSSSPPTTPNSKWPPSEAEEMTPDMENEPSTTPAGPPPRSAASFTPAGTPPSAIFGSSQFGTNVSKLKFGRPNPSQESRYTPQRQPERTKNGTPGGVLGRYASQSLSSSILSGGSLFDRSPSHPPQDENEDDFEDDFDDSMQMDQSAGGEDTAASPFFQGFTAVNTGPILHSSLGSRSDLSTPTNLRQSTFNHHTPVMSHQLPRKGRPDVIPKLAQDLAARSEPADLTEQDEMILTTEAIVTEVYEGSRQLADRDQREGLLAVQSLQLMRLWTSCAPPEQTLVEGVGPGPDASPLQKASYLSSLLLALHHPPFLSSALAPSHSFRDSRSMMARPRPMPIPRILIDWLNRYHLSYDDLFDAVRSTRPNCTANAQFWDLVFSMLVRGQTAQVTQLLSDADFHYADSALDEGSEEPGYRGAQLQAVQAAVYRAGEVLKGCPAASGNWDMDRSERELFRNRVSSELENLVDSTDSSGNGNGSPVSFQAENFGLPKAGRLLPRSTQSTRPKLPWSIRDNLQIFYGILMGNADAIIAHSQDWLEATASLTMWWDGAEDTDIARWSLGVSQARQSDDLHTLFNQPYLKRLRASFLCVTDPDYSESMTVNPLSQLEVGLACIMQGDVDGVLSSIRTFSLVIASAVADVGQVGGWLKATQPTNPSALDEDDLIVLSYGKSPQVICRDSILSQYAQCLFGRKEFANSQSSCEGWELALSVASRIEDRGLAHEVTATFLDEIELDSQSRLDRLLTLCTSLGLESEAREVSERFADHLSSNTTLYGTALLCYARSHSVAKIRQLVDVLISCSLVRSAAYPPPSELDDDLRILVENPKRLLARLNQIDPEAAATLQFYLAGYACLRRFYHLRDEGVAASSDKSTMSSSGARTSSMSPLSRKRGAAKSLIAVLNSAADAIYGGLYDVDRDAAIQVDGLLVLLGEVTALVADQGKNSMHVLTSGQIYDILAAIEDVQTVNDRVYQAIEECLRVTMRGYSDPNAVTSAVLAGNNAMENSTGNMSFSMLDSDMSSSVTGGVGKSIGGSGVLVQQATDNTTDGDEDGESTGQHHHHHNNNNNNNDKHKNKPSQNQITRGWDWRVRFSSNTSHSPTPNNPSPVPPPPQNPSHEILSFLRHALARELPFAELTELQLQRRQRLQRGGGGVGKIW